MATSTGEKPAKSLFAGFTFARIEMTTPTTAGIQIIDMNKTYGLPNTKRYILIGATRKNRNSFWYTYDAPYIAGVQFRYNMEESELTDWGNQPLVALVAYF